MCLVSIQFWHSVANSSVFATLSLKAGIPTEVVSRILGHRNPVITQLFYQHAVPCLEEDAIARFAALVDGSKAA